VIYSFKGKTPQIHPTAYVAPGAQIIGDVVLEENASVWFNAVLRGDNAQIRIGKGSNIQDGTVVHVDPGYPVNVGEYVTVGHNVTLHGCTVEDGALIGMGATLLNGSVIGKNSLIAAGALISEGKKFEPEMLAAGVPAKTLRKLSSEHVERMRRGTENYIEKGKLYKEENIQG
jgi:carbonic anhydrase/acetyltransferase-like protein (isoleucine patch superfamily)